MVREELRGWKVWEILWIIVACGIILGLSIYWQDMVQQNADPRLLELLDIAASEPSDVCSLSKNAQSLTAADLETIRIRAEERRARARMHSRC